MDWFHHTRELGWLVAFWVITTLVMLGASWLFTRGQHHPKLRSTTSR